MSDPKKTKNDEKTAISACRLAFDCRAVKDVDLQIECHFSPPVADDFDRAEVGEQYCPFLERSGQCNNIHATAFSCQVYMDSAMKHAQKMLAKKKAESEEEVKVVVKDEPFDPSINLESEERRKKKIITGAGGIRK